MEYTTIKIPVQLAKSIDKLIEELELGFRNRTEYVNHLLRNKINELKQQEAVASV